MQHNSSSTPNDMKKLFCLVFAFTCFACSSDEPNCINDHSISGSIYEAVGPLNEEETDEIEFFIYSESREEREEALPLCDPETFSSILPESYQARLDSAYINHCEPCIQVTEWSGPGCPLEPAAFEGQGTFHNTPWRIARLEFLDGVLYPPCNVPMRAFFRADGSFDLKISGDQEGQYEFDGQEFLIVRISEIPGFFNGGYLGLFEHQLRSHLYERFEPLQVSLQDNELVFFRESPYVRIVLIR